MLLSDNEKEQIKQNEQEDKNFIEQLDKYYNKDLKIYEVLKVGITSNALAVAGANKEYDVIIHQSTIKKCISKASKKIRHGHNLEREIIENIPQQLRNPILIIKNTNDNALIAITDLKDKENNQIIMAISLSNKYNHIQVNRIASMYGKENFPKYLKIQALKENIVAINKEKAEKLFQSVGVQSPDVETIISFNDSIAYTTTNVKYPTKIKERNDNMDSKSVLTMTESEVSELISNVPKVPITPNAVFDSEITNSDFEKINQLEITGEQQTVSRPNEQEEVVAPETNDIQSSEIQPVKTETIDISDEESEKKTMSYTNIKDVNYSDLKDLEIRKKAEEQAKLDNIRINGESNENVIGENGENDIIFTLHKQAEEENNAYAQNILGVCYAVGSDVQADDVKSIEFFEQAVAQNYAPAQRNLAIILENSSTPDMDRVIDLYKKAAEQKDAFALNNLAVCYLIGDGVKKDAKTAVKYFEQAVKGDDDFAMVNLGDCYSIGNGVIKNDTKAFNLYQQAANKENVNGIRKLAECYLNGTGTKQNLEQAVKYYKQAANLGDNRSSKMVEELTEKLNLSKHSDINISAQNAGTKNLKGLFSIAQKAAENANKEKTKENSKTEPEKSKINKDTQSIN